MHLLFDLDGTLTDPAVGIVACLRHSLEAMGSDSPHDSDLARFIGPPLQETFAELLGTSDTRVIESAIEHYRGRFAEVGLFENYVYPGIPQALSELAGMGHDFRVVTSKPHVFAERIIDHFELREFFPEVYGSELSGERTNKGDLIQHLLRVEALNPGTTCMIGDRRHDIDGARVSGVLSVGVLWGFGTRSELEAAAPDRIVQEVGDLAESVHELASDCN